MKPAKILEWQTGEPLPGIDYLGAFTNDITDRDCYVIFNVDEAGVSKTGLIDAYSGFALRTALSLYAFAELWFEDEE